MMVILGPCGVSLVVWWASKLTFPLILDYFLADYFWNYLIDFFVDQFDNSLKNYNFNFIASNRNTISE